MVNRPDDPAASASASAEAPARRAAVDNALELRVFALQRSGHHAVMNWVLANTRGRYCFLNDCRPQHPPFHVERIAKNPDHWLRTNIPDLDYRAEAEGRHAPKDLMIYNYEDRSLAEVETAAFRRHRAAWVGTSARRRDLIIVRDPLNVVASRLKKFLPRVKNRQRWYRRMTMDLWLEHARAALRGPHGFEDPIIINYNHFVADPSARAEAAEALSFEADDASLETVSTYGGGSSFSGTERPPSVEELTARWRSFEGDPYFRSFFADPAVLASAEPLFGGQDGFEPMRAFLEECAGAAQGRAAAAKLLPGFGRWRF